MMLEEIHIASLHSNCRQMRLSSVKCVRLGEVDCLYSLHEGDLKNVYERLVASVELVRSTHER